MTGEGAVVLLAEDEPLASMALRAQVEALGHSVVAVARDGAEAAALARCVPADLAIFDMKMPAMTGLDAARDAFPDAPTPVLLLTGYGAADLPDPVPEPPIFSVVTKPVGLTDLGRAIGGALQRFDRWLHDDHHADPDAVRRARDDRRDIARALEATGENPTGAAALRFLARARDEGATPADLARRLLRELDA